MRKTIIAGNWKMNTTLEAAEVLVRDLASLLRPTDRVERVICPPFPWIVPLTDRAYSAGLLVGAQDCAAEDEGAFTGEVSAKMLAPFCRYIIVGHSERRHILNENDELVAAKFRAVLRNQRRPILCVGETLSEREAGNAQEVVSRQLRSALMNLPSDTLTGEEVVIAYEPVWAIGTGRSASPDDADQMSAHIRAVLNDILGEHVTGRVRIQYGGSVSPENARAFLELADIDGLLVGGASLKPDAFARIIEASGAD